MMTFFAKTGCTFAVTVGAVKRMSDFALDDVMDELFKSEHLGRGV